jgi:hypothetical protein
MATPAGFSPMKEIWKRVADGCWKATKNVATWGARYIYSLFIPNLIVFAFILLLTAPIWGGLLVVYPPLLYLRDNQAAIFGDFATSSNTLNAVLQSSFNTINGVLHSMRGGFQIYDVVIDWGFFIGVKFYQVFGCVIGHECEPFVQMFKWIGQVIPFSISIFWIIWNGIGNTLIPLTTVLSVDDPYEMNAQLYLNGTSLLVQDMYSNMTRDMTFGLAHNQNSRLVYTERMSDEWAGMIRTAREQRIQFIKDHGQSVWRKDEMRAHAERTEVPNSNPGQCVPGNLNTCIPTAGSCGGFCDIILVVTEVVFKPEVITTALEIFKFLVDYGLDIIKQFVEDAVNFFLPFLKWLLNFTGNDLVGYFADLFSRVDALFTWVGDVWDSFINVWDVAMATIFGFFGSLIAELESLFADLLVWISASFEVFKAVLAGALVNLVNALQAALDAIAGAICSALDIMCEVCRNLPGCSGMGHVPKCPLIPPSYRNCNNRKRSIESYATSDFMAKHKRSEIPRMVKYHDNSRYRQAPQAAFISEPLPFPYPMGAIRDLSYGNLTIDRGSLCAPYLHFGFDPYEFYKLGKVDQYITIGCIVWIQFKYYPEESALMANPPAGSTAKRSVLLGTEDDTAAVKSRLMQFVDYLKSSKSSNSAAYASIKKSTEGMGTPLSVQEQARKPAPANFSDTLNQMLEANEKSNKKRQTVETDDPNMHPVDKLFANVKKRSEERRSRIPAHRWVSLTESLKRAYDVPAVQRLVGSFDSIAKTDWTLNYLEVRHPRIHERGTPENIAFEMTREFEGEWEKFGRMLSTQPSMHQVAAYIHANGTKLRNFMQMIKKNNMATMEARGVHHMDDRNYVNDFWNWLTSGLWVNIGNKFADVVDWFVDCNPLPIPVGPGGDPNPNTQRFCIPYIDPDIQLKDPSFTLSIIFPACCPPGEFTCPSSFNTGFGELLFMFRMLSHWYNIKWPFGFLNFPGGVPPDYGWYCFFVCIGGLLEYTFWALLVAIFLLVWILPITLVTYGLITCCCAVSFGLCRTICYPTGICKPRSAKKLSYQKDIALLRMGFATIPGCGCCGKGLIPAGGIKQSFSFLSTAGEMPYTEEVHLRAEEDMESGSVPSITFENDDNTPKPPKTRQRLTTRIQTTTDAVESLFDGVFIAETPLPSFFTNQDLPGVRDHEAEEYLKNK